MPTWLRLVSQSLWPFILKNIGAVHTALKGHRVTLIRLTKQEDASSTAPQKISNTHIRIFLTKHKDASSTAPQIIFLDRSSSKGTLYISAQTFSNTHSQIFLQRHTVHFSTDPQSHTHTDLPPKAHWHYISGLWQPLSNTHIRIFLQNYTLDFSIGPQWHARMDLPLRLLGFAARTSCSSWAPWWSLCKWTDLSNRSGVIARSCTQVISLQVNGTQQPFWSDKERMISSCTQVIPLLCLVIVERDGTAQEHTQE